MKPRRLAVAPAGALGDRHESADRGSGGRDACRLQPLVPRQIAQLGRARDGLGPGAHAVLGPREAQDPMAALDRDEGRAAANRERLRVVEAAAPQGSAARAEHRGEDSVRQAGEAPAGERDAGREPAGLVGDRDDLGPVAGAPQAREAAELALARLKLQPGAEGERAEARRAAVARGEGLDRRGADRDGRRPVARVRRLSPGGRGEKAEGRGEDGAAA
jgi:hypothetical protein